MTEQQAVIDMRLAFVRGVILKITRARYGLADWDKEYRGVKKLIRAQFGEKPAMQLRACRWSVPIRRQLDFSIQKSSLSEGWLRSAEDYFAETDEVAR